MQNNDIQQQDRETESAGDSVRLSNSSQSSTISTQNSTRKSRQPAQAWVLGIVNLNDV